MRLLLVFAALGAAATGQRLTDVDPPSTLLPPQTSAIDFSARSAVPASCAYSIGSALPYERMTPFTAGQGATLHRTRITGLDPDTTRVNEVYVMCTSSDEPLHLRYRSLPPADAPFPRVGNLWGTGQILPRGLEHAARIALHLGANFKPDQIRKLRALNPNILILTSINTVENGNLPDDYYLHDTEGNKIEVWPNIYRLNLTKKYVAEYQARYAYERILKLDLMVDGCFFDNFFTNQSWLKQDIHGRAIQLDADGDGKPDDPKQLDALWREGVFHELRMWRKLMPHALASGHLFRPAEPDVMEIFNGDSVGFMTTRALEGQISFVDVWELYESWFERGRKPVLMMIESAPHNQIAYGYDYTPLQKIPPSTLEFARTYSPFVRFGLAFTLMKDGYFAHEFGDTWHGNDWWYEELDFDLGQPLGPAKRVNEPARRAASLLADGSPAEDALIQEQGTAIQGSRELAAGTRYDLSFEARSDGPRQIIATAQRRGTGRGGYNPSRTFAVGRDWQTFAFPFESNGSAGARVEFGLGSGTAKAWVRNVRLTERPPDIWRRDFANGIALLNGTRQRQIVKLGAGYRRLTGRETPRHEYIVDDDSPAFSSEGGWREAIYDSGQWKSKGPFFHNWGKNCHEMNGGGTAEWKLSIPEDDTYTIAAWWPAAPSSAAWTTNAVYEVWSGGKLMASKALDQTKTGDEWHEIATVRLTAAAKPVVRLRNGAAATVIADALLLRSAKRFNDGSPVKEVTLEPMDGMVLQRTTAARRR